jgi:hypothetical protein
VGVVTRDIGTMLREKYFENPGKLSITISKDLAIAQGISIGVARYGYSLNQKRILTTYNCSH